MRRLLPKLKFAYHTCFFTELIFWTTHLNAHLSFLLIYTFEMCTKNHALKQWPVTPSAHMQINTNTGFHKHFKQIIKEATARRKLASRLVV